MKKREAGVTLIELMIGVLIVSLLAFVAVPLTGNWVDNAQWVEARGVLEQAVGRAKADAMRNPNGVAGNDAATALCLADNTLTLQQAQDTDEAASCASTADPVWSAKIPPRVTLKAGGADLQCLCFNNKSRLLTHSGACGGSCASTLDLNIVAGAEDETVGFY